MSDGWIPQDWTFKSAGVATNFDRHVREQLPWYDLATRAVAHIARHYIPNEGMVYDVGASTGNVGRAMQDVLTARKARFVAVEESEEMAEKYQGPPTLVISDALKYQYEPFDFAVVFLCMMFFPVAARKDWLWSMARKMKRGGALVVVDKIVTPHGYAGTVLRRMAMSWKLESGTDPKDIVAKELSLAGYQRPVSPHVFDPFPNGCADVTCEVFFALGEFCGWLLEKRE